MRKERVFLWDSIISDGSQMVGKAILCLHWGSDSAIHTIKHNDEYPACAWNSRMFLAFPSQKWLSSFLVYKKHWVMEGGIAPGLQMRVWLPPHSGRLEELRILLAVVRRHEFNSQNPYWVTHDISGLCWCLHNPHTYTLFLKSQNKS